MSKSDFQDPGEGISSEAALDLRFSDLSVLLVVERTGSAAAAARELRVSISRVSKILARVETRLGRRIFARGTRGVHLTDEGRRLIPELRALTARFADLARGARGGADDAEPRSLDLTIAAEPYLIAMLLPAICRSYPRLRVRGVGMAPAVLRARIADATLDAALISVGPEDGPRAGLSLPRTWERDRVGKIRKGLFTTPEVADRLGPIVAQSVVAKELFVSPLAAEGPRATLFEDDCPLPAHQRRIGHQIDTAAVGLDVAAATGEVVFAPVVLARRHVGAKLLREVRVRGWHVHPDLWLAYHKDRVLKPVRDAILRELRVVLGDG